LTDILSTVLCEKQKRGILDHTSPEGDIRMSISQRKNLFLVQRKEILVPQVQRMRAVCTVPCSVGSTFNSVKGEKYSNNLIKTEGLFAPYPKRRRNY
jgi:hypothetical protein